MERLALPWGETARQFTKLMLSLLSHIGKRNAKAELNRRSQACEVLAGTGIRVAKYWKWSSMRVSRPLLLFGRQACFYQHLCSEMESRAGVAPASAVLQTAA